MTAPTVTEFVMPSLGADMDSGVLLEWLVQPGDTVHKGDIVAVVDTAKAAVEVECFAGGVIQELLVTPGTKVAVGTALATIATAEAGAAKESRPAPAVETPVPAVEAPAPTVETLAPTVEKPALTVETPAPAPAAAAGLVTSPLVRRLARELDIDAAAVVGTGEGGRVTHADIERQARTRSGKRWVKASPMARRLGTELHVDLATLHGTGPGGAVLAGDVRKALPAKPSAPQRAGTDAMRAAIAALMARSKREIPHYYLTERIDLGPALRWMHERNRHLPVTERLVPAALLLKASALAAARVPELNGFWLEDHLSGQTSVHLGVAISLRGGGLVAPAIHDADKLPLEALMAAMRDLVTRTRAGRLRGSELADPTITVSNLGEQGAESILGVIYPPQVALVGFGRIVERPWAVDGLIGVRPVVTAGLSADHRATDGATGARYLHALAQLLRQPEEL